MHFSTPPLAALLIALLPALWGTTVEAQTTQKQWRLIKDGPQGFKLQLSDVPVRQPGANEVLLRMHAASLNRRDVFVTKGQYPIGPRDSLVPLSDGAGEVVKVGPGVTRVRVGDKVAPIFFQGWAGGRPTANVTETALGGQLDGVLSQYVTLNEQGLVKLPAGLSF